MNRLTDGPAGRLRLLEGMLLVAVLCVLALVGGAFLRTAPAQAAGGADPLVQAAVQQAQLTAGDGAAFDLFGYSVALSGDTALVGSYVNESAYVFTRSGSTWSQQAELTASDGVAGDQFGYSVAVSGDTALVGAIDADVGANADQGAAYVFARSGTTWSQQAKLTVNDGHAGDEFGSAVALEGNTAVVAAIYGDVGYYADQGWACVFTRSGATWSQQAKLIANDGQANDDFGVSVALSGDTALIGAFGDDIGANLWQGSAYVFVRSGATWSQQARLTASDGATLDKFGHSVALSGDTALIGACWHAVGTNLEQGAAYAFTRSGTSWSQQAELTAASGAALDHFGFAVALAGDQALLGSPGDDVGVATDQGSVSVFGRTGTDWSEQALLTAGDGAEWDGFGNAVAATGNAALVGASGDNVGANADQGSAYVFDVDIVAPVTTAAVTPAATTAGWNNSGVTVTLSAGDAGTGVDTTYYRFGVSGGFSIYDPAAKPTVSAEGTTTLQYYSTDVAGNVEGTKSIDVKIDRTPPETSVTVGSIPSGWSTSPVTVAFLASDALSGMTGGGAHTEYSTDGGARWTSGGSATVRTEGTTTLLYRSVDAAGNVETPSHSATLQIDMSPPQTTASGVPTGWSKNAVDVTLNAADAHSGMAGGSARTEWSTDGGSTWTIGTSLNVSAQGATDVLYRSVDFAGNAETTQSAAVRIDGAQPTTKAYAASVKKGKKVKLRFRVDDPVPGSGQAAVTLKIFKGAKLKKTLKLSGARPSNAKQSYSWRCTLPRGKYTVTVYAEDLAGNVQSRAGSAKLTVK